MQEAYDFINKEKKYYQEMLENAEARPYACNDYMNGKYVGESLVLRMVLDTLSGINRIIFEEVSIQKEKEQKEKERE